MTVENVTYISDLDQNNPAGGDSISEGDDHIRNIKKAIKGTFPNVTDAVTVTSEELNQLPQIIDSVGSGRSLPRASTTAPTLSTDTTWTALRA